MQRNPKPELAEEMEEIEERTKQAGCKESDALPWYVLYLYVPIEKDHIKIHVA